MHNDLIHKYFSTKGFLVPQVPAEARAVRYIDLGWVDSVGILEFVSFIEDATGLSLTDDDLMSEEFQTLGGVSDVLQRKVAAQ